jgi:apoptosis-inducing factor 3
MLARIREVELTETRAMAGRDPDDGRVFVIIGAGAAGYSAAQTLREDGYAGRVVMVTREDRLPYDRPNLSKDYLQGRAEPEWMPLRPEEFFAEHGIEVALGREVIGVDAASRIITFGDGATQRYDALLLATGGAARKLTSSARPCHASKEATKWKPSCSAARALKPTSLLPEWA